MTDRLPELYKVLAADGSACHGGTGQWYLPRGERPGRWMPPIGWSLSGYRLVTAEGLLQWLDSASRRVYRAEVRGEWKQEGEKCCAAEARLLGPRLHWDERIARLYACDCAERVLPLWERQYPGDERPRRCLAVARAYADGEATADELTAARDAAWAARYAAWAAAEAASRYAAGITAWAAAEAAARAAAETAWTAAGAAARAAERAWQTERLVWHLETGGKISE